MVKSASGSKTTESKIIFIAMLIPMGIQATGITVTPFISIPCWSIVLILALDIIWKAKPISFVLKLVFSLPVIAGCSFLIFQSTQVTRIINEDHSILILPTSPQKIISFTKPIDGKFTNLKIRSVGNGGTKTEDFILLKSKEIIYRLSLAPAGGYFGSQSFKDSWDDTFSYKTPSMGVTFSFSYTLEIIDKTWFEKLRGK